MRAEAIRLILLSVVLVMAPPVAAADAVEAALARLVQPFDARPMGADEKRLLQFGLVATDDYVGVIDGAWGRRSQEALERFASRERESYDGEALMVDAALVAIEAVDTKREADLRYHRFPGAGLALAAPEGRFAERTTEDGFAYRSLERGDLEVVLFSGAAPEAFSFHRSFVADHDGDPPYLVRKPERWVSSTIENGRRAYLRSEPARAGRWWTVIVFLAPDGDIVRFNLALSSITTDLDAGIAAPQGAVLYRAVEDVFIVSREPDDAAAAEGGAAAPPSAGGLRGSGTGFYVNNTDIVTAAHVIDGCATLTLEGGEPLRLVARHPGLDLAILTGARRSRSWLALDRLGEARLGQRVFALGYPYYRLAGTSLNLTSGNVSAERGLIDDPTQITISAAVQPGNSGGPLLDRKGAILGVVIARLSPRATGTERTPENVNYAIRGPS